MQPIVLRNPNVDPIGTDQLRRFSPAIFSREPFEGVSERYGHVPTYRVIESMHKAGFVPTEVRNYMRRDESRMPFTKHMIRFRQVGDMRKQLVGDVVPQVVLINSHDRSSLYELYSGLFRLVCANGLLAADADTVKALRVRHTKGAVEEVVERSLELMKHQKAVFTYVEAMRKIMLTDRQAKAFAKSAGELLHYRRAGTFNPVDLLVPRREEDKPNDVWHVMNRVQENITKGGIMGHTASNRIVRSGPTNAINADMTVNKGVWALAVTCISKAKAK